MTKKTKTITQAIPTKSSVRKCFICCAEIPIKVKKKGNPKPLESIKRKTRGTKVKSASCKSSGDRLYTQELRKSLGKVRRIKSLANIAEKQKSLPIARFKDTNKVLGY